MSGGHDIGPFLAVALAMFLVAGGAVLWEQAPREFRYVVGLVLPWLALLLTGWESGWQLQRWLFQFAFCVLVVTACWGAERFLRLPLLSLLPIALIALSLLVLLFTAFGMYFGLIFLVVFIVQWMLG